MNDKPIGWQETAGCITQINLECHAFDDFFEPDYDDVPEEYKQAIEELGGLPCDGGGMPGFWCIRGNCPYIVVED